jgi:hypothetical protein
MDVNTNVEVENGIGTIRSIGANSEHARSVICERLHGGKGGAGHVFSGVAEMQLVFPHAL